MSGHRVAAAAQILAQPGEQRRAEAKFERPSTWSKVRADYAIAGEHWAKSLACAVIVFVFAAALWAVLS